LSLHPDILSFYIVFFFFQAEDGIRDRNVTGVQTCALPISKLQWSTKSALPIPMTAKMKKQLRFTLSCCGMCASTLRRLSLPLVRSEERRVGKACTCQSQQ